MCVCCLRCFWKISGIFLLRISFISIKLICCLQYAENICRKRLACEEIDVITSYLPLDSVDVVVVSRFET